MDVSTILMHVKKLFGKKRHIALAAVALAGGGWWWAGAHKPTEPLRYVLAAVQKGTVVSSVSGSGQVSGKNELAVKPTVSGSVTNVLVKDGDVVKEGDILVQLDTKDAQKTVRDAAQGIQNAKLSLASAALSLQKLQAGADAQTLLKAQDAVDQAQRNLDDLKKGSDATDISQAEADLAIKQDAVKLAADGTTPQTVRDALDAATTDIKAEAVFFLQALRDADDILGVDDPTPAFTDNNRSLLSAMNSSLLPTAQNTYAITRGPVQDFKSVADALPVAGADEASMLAVAAQGTRTADVLAKLLEQTQDVLLNTITSSSFSQSTLDGLRSTISTDRSSVATKRAALVSVPNDVRDAKTSYANALLAEAKSQAALDKLKEGASASDIATAEERLKEARAALDALTAGPDAMDIATQQNAIAQRRMDVTAASSKWQDAQDALASYTIRAPFDGTVTGLSVNKKDTVSASTALLTLLTDAKVANLTLNEVDTTKVHAGQKATLTFDAVPDLSIAGTVATVDSVGTISQGVVNYGVTIAFQTQDDRIKSGMSVSASIVTDAHPDVLVVPNSALQTSGNGSVVETLSPADKNAALSTQGVTSDVTPTRVPVQTGLANDEETEITSGLKEGDLVIIRTIDPNVKTAAAATGAAGASGVRIPGLTGGGGGFGGGGNAAFRARGN